MTYVWVVQQFMGCEPTIERYELFKQHRDSVTVNKRGHPVVIRKAAGRSFYYTQADFEANIIRVYQTCIGNAESRIRRYRERIAQRNFEVEMIPGTPRPRERLLL